VTTLNERMLASGQKITVVQADITNVAVDTIVHPTSNQIHFGGQVGHAISQAGGEQLRKSTAELSHTHGNLPKCGGRLLIICS
jgi:O-acetyl-ADP-ribose deacetylase (regulator of RNase III)